MQVTFRHPLNSTRDTITVWTTCVPALLLGPIYFTFVGAWPVAAVLWLAAGTAFIVASPAAVALAVALWLAFAALAWRIRARLYRRRGWIEAGAAGCAAAAAQQRSVREAAAANGGH